ncbi:hypothetical protein U1Q18_035207 [Sarracenia purpurea var. burkii]
MFGRSRRLRRVTEEEEGCDADGSEGSGEEEELQSGETSGLRIRWAIIRCGGPAVEDWALKQGIVFANFADLRQKEEDLVAGACGGEERKEIGEDFGAGHRKEPAKKACRIPSRRSIYADGGVAVSRLGLWMFDLSVIQQMQDQVSESDRMVVGGVQNSLQSVLDLMTYVMGVIISNPQVAKRRRQPAVNARTVCRGLGSVFGAKKKKSAFFAQ